MLITNTTRNTALLAFIAASGMAGCNYDHNTDWSTVEPTTEVITVEQANATQPMSTGANASQEQESIWDGLFSDSSETEPNGAASPVDVFGSVEGRSMIQGNPNAPAAYDPADLLRVTFSDYGADFDPVISENGEYVFFASTRHRETADIYRKHVNSRVVTQITSDPGHDVMPALSPDGRTIAFASNRQGSWNIYVIDSNGGQARQITQDSANELHPSFSPDGQKLIYCRLGPVSQRWEMWLADVNNPMVKHQIGFGLFPEFSPKAGTGANGSDRIIFQRARERGSRLFSVWSMDIQGDEAGYLTELASSADHALINPTWSRDGKRIAFASVPLSSTTASGQPTRADIWMMNIDGTGETNLTADDAVNLMPTWGKGNSVFFISNRSGTDNIWSLGANKAVIAAGEPFVDVNFDMRTADTQNMKTPSKSESDASVANFPVGDE
ncbi:MAG TPA: hypothetical protein ENJ00_01330 [Phycisphaerales bacterium]|nr:hypothetical protein [Phycisphaerales bacterium]